MLFNVVNCLGGRNYKGNTAAWIQTAQYIADWFLQQPHVSHQ